MNEEQIREAARREIAEVSLREGISLLEAAQLVLARHEQIGSLSARLQAHAEGMVVLYHQAGATDHDTLETLMARGAITATQVDDLMARCGLTVSPTGELTGPDGETETALGLTNEQTRRRRRPRRR